MVPEGLKPQECERVKLWELPPVPYVPKKDEVQDEVSKKRNMEIKMTIEKDMLEGTQLQPSCSPNLPL